MTTKMHSFTRKNINQKRNIYMLIRPTCQLVHVCRLHADIPSNLNPSKMWTSPSPDIAIIGRNKKMKCIFGGL